MQRGHAGRGGDRVRRAGELRERCLELLDARTVGEDVAVRAPPRPRRARRRRASGGRRGSGGWSSRCSSAVQASGRPAALRALDREAARPSWRTPPPRSRRAARRAGSPRRRSGSGRPCARPGRRVSSRVARGSRRSPLHSVASSSAVQERPLGPEHLHRVEVRVHAAEVGRDLRDHAVFQLEAASTTRSSKRNGVPSEAIRLPGRGRNARHAASRSARAAGRSGGRRRPASPSSRAHGRASPRSASRAGRTRSRSSRSRAARARRRRIRSRRSTKRGERRSGRFEDRRSAGSRAHAARAARRASVLGRAERLLDEHVQAALERRPDLLEVVRSRTTRSRPRRRRPSSRSAARSKRRAPGWRRPTASQPLGVEVAQRDDLAVGVALPRLGVLLADAEADDPYPEHRSTTSARE